MIALIQKTNLLYLGSYFVLFSALIISIRTDLEHMLISRLVSLYLVPLGLILSYLKLLPLTPLESLIGATISFLFLTGFAHLFYRLTNQDGLGEGDIELMAMIGSFVGIPGAWITLIVASIGASFVGLIHLALTKSRIIPFGPFLALGAMSYILLNKPLLQFFFPGS